MNPPESEESCKMTSAAAGHSPSLADRLKQQGAQQPSSTAAHVIVEARAGTGKTTTLVEGLKRLKGLPVAIDPSPQQAAVWEAIEQSRGCDDSVALVAFNRSIATELQQRVPEGCNAMTMHSLGFKAVCRAFLRTQLNNYRVQDIISELLGQSTRSLRYSQTTLLSATEKLVGLCKMNLVPDAESSQGDSISWALSDLASHYDIDLSGEGHRVFDLVARVLERCKDVARDGCINFDDMIWLPVVLNLPVYQYSLLLVDECFPAGTLVETDQGLVPIERIAEGTGREVYILASLDEGKTLGYTRVKAAYRTLRNGPLVKVRHEHGEVICTANHPLWIERKGWTPAGLAKSGDALSYVRRTNSEGEQDLLSEMLGSVSRTEKKVGRTTSVENPDLSTQGNLRYLRKGNRTESQDLLAQVRGCLEETEPGPKNREVETGQDIQTDEGSSQGDSQPDGRPGCQSPHGQNYEAKGRSIHQGESRREWENIALRKALVSSPSETPATLAVEPRVCCRAWPSPERVSDQLQGRYSCHSEEDRSGGRWPVPPQSGVPKAGLQEGQLPGISRVVSVEVYQPGSDRRPKEGSSKNHQYVYTLATEAGCYFANGILAKNCQDLGRCQQALARRADRRLILCGDPKQAIYGFAGADHESMARLERELEDTPQGCIHLSLTVTRRCGKAIVEEARRYVPDFEAHESNGEGTVGGLSIGDDPRSNYRRAVQDGDMILCRMNAPLVSECFKFLRQGRRAEIQGRDVGQGLISTINRLMKGYTPPSAYSRELTLRAADDYEGRLGTGQTPEPSTVSAEIEELLRRLSDWLHTEQRKEQAKRNPSDARLMALQDRYDCLVCFTEDQPTVESMVNRIEQVFTDSKDAQGIRLSSVHKAKGLEAQRVFFIRTKDAPCPHPMARTSWARAQEQNLLYVGITRAIEELIWVSD